MQIVERGIKDGFKYMIYELERYYTAYVSLPEVLRNKVELDDLSNVCNGGITHKGTFEDERRELGYCIGWDYGHHWNVGKKIPIQKIEKEIDDVIEEIQKLGMRYSEDFRKEKIKKTIKELKKACYLEDPRIIEDKEKELLELIDIAVLFAKKI